VENDSEKHVGVFKTVSFSEGVRAIARWKDAENSLNLVQSPYGLRFGLIAFSKHLDGIAQAAIATGIYLDEQEDPERPKAGRTECSKQVRQDSAGKQAALPPVTTEPCVSKRVRKPMANRIRVGTMLVEDGTRAPESLIVQPYSIGWLFIVESTAAQLDKEIDRAGWTFFYMDGEIRMRGFGFNDQSRIDRAVAHVSMPSSCLEITQIKQRSFWGFSCTSVVAHARHIQMSRRFQSLSSASTA
jgi:hypothetical protein